MIRPLLLLSLILVASSQDLSFFAFDNGIGRGVKSPAEQAAVLREIGYAGISYEGVGTLDDRIAICAATGVRVVASYVHCHVGRDPDPALLAALPTFAQHGVVVWLTVQGQGDVAAATAAVRAVAEPAARHGAQVVLYPHHGFLVSQAEQALPIIRALGLANVGVTVNLCHELRAGNGARMSTVIDQVAPYLRMVSINGADHDGRDWSTLIQPLGQGSFDVKAMVDHLRNIGYRGPVGLQGYNVPGDQVDNLRRSMAAWRTMTGN